MDTFESWLLHPVAQAVEAGEVPADLLVELQTEFDAVREKSLEGGHPSAIQYIADLAGVPEDEARCALETFKTQPTVTRELLMRQFAEAWLGGEAEGVLMRRLGG